MSVEVVRGGQRRIDRSSTRGSWPTSASSTWPGCAPAGRRPRPRRPTSPTSAGCSRAASTSSGPSWCAAPRAASTGEAIPLGARTFAVADAFDAMTSDRPYRRALPFARACQEIVEGAGSQFDPRVVEAFAAVAGDLPDLHASLHTSPSLG